MNWKLRKWLLLGGAALAILTLLPFSRALGYTLHDLDDYVYLVRRPLTILFDNYESIWMPLTRLSYLTDSIVWGDWWGGFHLTSILFHCANAILLWLLLRHLARHLKVDGKWLPFIAALVWAVHPLRCESVILLSSRKDVMSLFFELLAILFWMRPRHSIFFTSLSLVCFAMGACCKPSVMTFPILCFLLDAFIRREVRPLRYVLPIAMMLGLGAFAAWQQADGGAARDMFGQPLWGRLLGAAAAFGIYVRNELWPSSLAIQCIKTWPVWPRFWFPGVVISGACGIYLIRRFSLYWRERQASLTIEKSCEGFPVRVTSSAPADPVLAAVAWFAFSVAPMLGVSNFGYHAFADRFTYIPAIGFSIFLLTIGGLRKGCAVVTAAVAVATAILGFCTWRQAGYWENDGRLFQHTLEVDGDGNTCAHGVLANWYWEGPHDLERCVAEFEKVEKQNLVFVHDSFEVYIFALCELGRTERIPEILANYERSLIETFGRDVWSQAWTNEGDRGPAKHYRQIYRIAKAAWWLTDPKTIPLAEEYVADTQFYREKRDAVWLYLNWKLAEAKYGVGSSEALAARETLNKDGVRMGYVQFRYLRDDPTPRFRP